ncbi:hypothetical protein [Pseudanabaena minima]|uniref:hypothetical protein n=1 Tax=Pseudanabaena minima TaxID=890415 RepID=UPI003DAA0A9B
MRSHNHPKKTSVIFKAAKRSRVYFGFDLGDRFIRLSTLTNDLSIDNRITGDRLISTCAK